MLERQLSCLDTVSFTSRIWPLIGVASTSQLGGPYFVKDVEQQLQRVKLGCALLGKLEHDIEF